MSTRPAFFGEIIHVTLEPSWPQLSIIMIRILGFIVFTKTMNLWARWSWFDFHFSLFVFRFWFFAFRFSIFELSRKIVFWHSKSYFDIRTESEKASLIFKILFCHSNWVGKSYFDIQNPILTFELSRKMLFLIQNPILTFELSRKMLFWYSKSYFDIRTESENRI